jgi:multiple sugar transport system ATP-binding protein
MTMGDRVAVLKDGLLQQVDNPLSLYDRPVNAFVAGFIGSPAMNLMQVPVDDEGVKLDNLTVPLTAETRQRIGGAKTVTLGVRPESFKVVPEDEKGVPATVDVVEELGADAFVYAHRQGEAEASEDNLLVARHDARRLIKPGATVRFAADPDKLHLFSVETGERLSD